MIKLYQIRWLSAMLEIGKGPGCMGCAASFAQCSNEPATSLGDGLNHIYKNMTQLLSRLFVNDTTVGVGE